jgi:hypothetical protein
VKNEIYTLSLDPFCDSTSCPPWGKMPHAPITTHSHHHDVLFCLRSKTMDPADHGLKSLKAWVKINPSSLNLFSQMSCHRNKKLMNTKAINIPSIKNSCIHSKRHLKVGSFSLIQHPLSYWLWCPPFFQSNFKPSHFLKSYKIQRGHMAD